MTPRRLAAAAAAALALAGCGGLDSEGIEGQIEEDLTAQVAVGVESVDCPDDLDSDAGQTFQCTATGKNGGEAVIDVRQVDDDGNLEFRARDLSALSP